jgi:hypothetical protein
MQPSIDIENLNLNIRSARKAVEELKRLGENFPAVARNAERMLASLKMLEINVSDVVGRGCMDPGDS